MAPLGSLLAFSLFSTPVPDKVSHTSGTVVVLDILPKDKVKLKVSGGGVPKSQTKKGHLTVAKSDTLAEKKPKTEVPSLVDNSMEFNQDTIQTLGTGMGNGSGLGLGTDSGTAITQHPEPKPVDPNTVVLTPDHRAVF